MSEPVFLPITKHGTKHGTKLKVTALGIEKPGAVIETLLQTITPNCPTYEKVRASEFKKKNEFEESAQETYFDKDGNELTIKPQTDDEIFKLRLLTNQVNLNQILDNFKDDTFFVKPYMYKDDGYTPYYHYEKDQAGGRKRKQSKYSSKKRSVKSHRLRNSRKRRYSRRR